MELTYAGSFDAVVVNDDLEEAVAETLRLIRSFMEAQPHA
jgi:guanylate kinase